MKTIATLMLVSLSLGTAFAANDQVFSWKNARGNNAYSDTPHNMQMGRSNVLNVRTGTVTPPAATQKLPSTVEEAQQFLNDKIAAENKRREEENAQRAAEIKAENCKTAQMNRANAANARNKDELIPKFDAMIAKYCQ